MYRGDIKTVMIRCENLGHTYQTGTPFEKAALKNVNLHIKKGELVAIIGRTGSGKSTLISHFNALEMPTEGRIFVGGVDTLEVKRKELINIRRKVGLVFQYPEHQLTEETVYDDIAFGPKNLKLSKVEIDDRVESALISVNLSKDFLSKSPFDISGGEKRRVAIAGVLAMEPEVLVLDEPCAGLDPKGRDELLDLIKKLNDCGMTVIFVSHSMEDVAETAKRIIVINDGTVAFDADTKSVFSHCDELTEMGLSVPEANIIANGLLKKGIGISSSVFTASEACDAVYSLYKKKIGD